MSSPPVRRSSGSYRDWTSLPPELLHQISEYTHLADFIRFRSVCPNWRAAATSPPPHLPWLLIDDRLPLENGDPPEIGDLEFYSLNTRRTHDVSVPQVKGKLIDGHGIHYILSFNNSDLGGGCFFNPLTGNKIALPILSTVWGNFYGFPICNSEYVACYLNYGWFGVLVSRRRTEIEWKTFDFSYGEKGPNHIIYKGKNFIHDKRGHTFYKGKYCIYDQASQHITILDMATDSIKSIHVLPPEGEATILGFEDDEKFNYLIESSGELLRVYHWCDGYQVYSVDIDCENPQWIKKNSIGDAMIFLDVFSGFSLRASDFPGFSGNCIYFMKRSFGITDVYKYYLEDGRTEYVTANRLGNCTWFVPSM